MLLSGIIGTTMALGLGMGLIAFLFGEPIE